MEEIPAISKELETNSNSTPSQVEYNRRATDSAYIAS